MMGEGYTSVKFDVSLPSARYIHSMLQGTGIDAVTEAYNSASSVSFPLVSLVKDGTYNIRFYMGEVTEITVTSIFVKNAYAIANSEYKTVTAADPVYDETAGTATMSYKVNVINHTSTYIYFDSALMNKMMEEGYTNVTFAVAQPTAAYISAVLKGTGLDEAGLSKAFGAVHSVSFGPLTLTANATYNICMYMGAITDMTVTVVFSK